MHPKQNSNKLVKNSVFQTIATTKLFGKYQYRFILTLEHLAKARVIVLPNHERSMLDSYWHQ